MESDDNACSDPTVGKGPDQNFPTSREAKRTSADLKHWNSPAVHWRGHKVKVNASIDRSLTLMVSRAQ